MTNAQRAPGTITGTDSDLSFILLAAVRYGLGRLSAAPSLIAGVVAQNLHVFDTPELETVATEIVNFSQIVNFSHPDDWNTTTWTNLAAVLLTEADRRKGITT